MTEQAIRIETDDDKAIYARCREVAGAPIVVISHGMTGHMNGHLEIAFARRLEREGYSSIRYNSYGWEDDARNLCEIGLSEQISDMSSVIEWAAFRTSAVIGLGHSFGATTLLLRGSAGLAGGVLWDPAPQRVWASMNREHATFDAGRREYVQRDRVAVIYSERILDEMDAADASFAAAAFEAPMLVISSPEWPHINEAGREYAAAAPKSNWHEIPNSDHSFSSDEAEAELFDLTISWLRKTIPTR